MLMDASVIKQCIYLVYVSYTLSDIKRLTEFDTFASIKQNSLIVIGREYGGKIGWVSADHL